MKRSGLLIMLLLTVCFAASVGADEQTVNLESRLIETFDTTDDREWVATASKFTMEGYPQTAYVETYPEALFRHEKDNQGRKVLGIRGQFVRQGYNFIEIYPVKGTDQDGRYIAAPIDIPGRAKNLNLWVWGSNHNFYLEAHFLDHKGLIHVVNLGDLSFLGWKKLQVEIPPRISQAVRYAPSFKGLKLIKFVVWTRPTEKVDDFYIYFDHVTVFTDVFESPFDGEDLANEELIKQVWSGEGK